MDNAEMLVVQMKVVALVQLQLQKFVTQLVLIPVSAHQIWPAQMVAVEIQAALARKIVFALHRQ